MIQYIDFSIVFAYLAVCLVLGLYKVKDIKNIREYALGNSFIPTTTLVATLFATYVGAGSTVGNIEKIHSMGLIFAFGMLSFPLIWVTTSKIFTNQIDYFKEKGCMTTSDIMEVLYGKPARWVTNFMFIFMVLGIMAMQGTAIGYLVNFFFGIDKEVGIVVGLGVLTFYSAFGGIRAVVSTDVFQSFILFVGIPAACFVAYYDLGGYTQLIDKLPKSHTSIELNEENILLLCSLFFYSAIPLSYSSFIQRFLMAKDRQQLKRVLNSNALISIPFVLILCMVGFIVKAKAPEINSNVAFYYLIDNYLPYIIKGFVISGIMAAIMSTADSWLNTASILIAHDLIKTTFPKISDKTEVAVARLSTILLGLLAMFFALTDNKSILEIDWLVSNFWEPVILVPIAAGFLKFPTSQFSFFAAGVTGITTVLIAKYFTGEFATLSLLCGVISSSLAIIISTYIQGWLNQKIIPLLQPTKSPINTSLSTQITNYLTFILGEIRKPSKYYYYFGISGLTYYLVLSLAINFSHSSVEILIIFLRLTALALCFILSTHEVYLSEKYVKRYMPFFWHFTLTFCLPFLSCYTLLASGCNLHWGLSFVLSVLILYLFSGWHRAIFLTLVGSVLALLMFAQTGYTIMLEVNKEAPLLLFIQVLCCGAILYFIKNKDFEYEKDIENKIIYGNSIAHEVKNTVASALMFTDVLTEMLINGRKVSQSNVHAIQDMLPSLKNTLRDGLSTIERILNATKTNLSSADDLGIHDICECIKTALTSMSLPKDISKRISFKSNETFGFYGSANFVQHVIVNLVNNSLKYSGNHAKIRIWCEKNKVYIHDNGAGIKPQLLKNIFAPFKSNSEVRGTGVGLAFCAKIMEELQGTIECESELGKYTLFTLTFPEVEVDEEERELSISHP